VNNEARQVVSPGAARDEKRGEESDKKHGQLNVLRVEPGSRQACVASDRPPGISIFRAATGAEGELRDR
jgi:hypothetical protein